MIIVNDNGLVGENGLDKMHVESDVAGFADAQSAIDTQQLTLRG